VGEQALLNNLDAELAAAPGAERAPGAAPGPGAEPAEPLGDEASAAQPTGAAGAGPDAAGGGADAGEAAEGGAPSDVAADPPAGAEAGGDTTARPARATQDSVSAASEGGEPGQAGEPGGGDGAAAAGAGAAEAPAGPAADAALGYRGTLPAPAARRLLGVLRLAIEARKPPLAELALDLLQKLIAHGHLAGPVHAVAHRRDAPGRGGGSAGRAGPRRASDEDLAAEPAAAGEPAAMPPQAQAVELLCRCDDVADDGVELRVLKGLLTAATSPHIHLHGQALLLAVRTCYNVFLVSRSDVNQTTAKATLTQMLTCVFQRMELGSERAQAPPLAVVGALGLPPAEASSVSAFVQSFLHEVVTSVDPFGTYAAGVQQGLDDAFKPGGAGAPDDSPLAGASGGADTGAERARALLRPPEAARGGAAPAGDAADGGGGAAAEAGAATGAPPEAAVPEANGAAARVDDAAHAAEGRSAADGDADEARPAPTCGAAHLGRGEAALVLADSAEHWACKLFTRGLFPLTLPNVSTGPASMHRRVCVKTLASRRRQALASPAALAAAAPAPAPLAPPRLPGRAADGAGTPRAQAAAPEVAALLAKDAFLVFRALCKLSIRTADSAAHADLTALRGKACNPALGLQLGVRVPLP